MDRVEKAARALDDAIDNALIAWGMGWDMDGVMACLKEAKDAAALSAASAEPVAAFTTGHCKEKQKPGGCQLHNLHCAYPDCDRKPVAPAPRRWREDGG